MNNVLSLDQEHLMRLLMGIGATTTEAKQFVLRAPQAAQQIVKEEFEAFEFFARKCINDDQLDDVDELPPELETIQRLILWHFRALLSSSAN